MKNLYSREWAFFKTNLAISFGWLIVLSVFFTGLLYLAFLQNPGAMAKVWKSIAQKFQEAGLISLLGENHLLLALKIFYINSRTTFIFTMFGFIPFFLGAALFLMLISVLLGVSLALTMTKGYGFLTFFKLTAPHGIIEIVAVIYGVSLGVYLSKEVTRKLFARRRSNSLPFIDLLKTISRSYLLVVLPLLALAAGIEVFVTALLR
jgi:stage II sporulation protein M